MVLRELDKALKTAIQKMSNKKITVEERAEWKRRYNALLKVVEYIKVGEWADAEERKKAIFILTKGYKAAGEKYGVSRQALSRSFAKANKEIEEDTPAVSLTIRLIMEGMISASFSYMESEKLVNEAGFMLFPKGVLELLPEPVACSDDEFNELELVTSKNRELRFLQSLTVNNICERMMKCDIPKLAKLLGAFSATADGEQNDKQFELAELLMNNDNRRG